MTLCAAVVALVAASPARADTVLTSCTPAAFDAAAAGGGTVTFAVDCPSITLSKTVVVGTGKVLDIEGNGHNVGLSGGGARRLFQVNGGTLTVRGVRLSSGSVIGANGANGTNGTAGAAGAPGTNGRGARPESPAAAAAPAAQGSRARPAPEAPRVKPPRAARCSSLPAARSSST